MKMPVWLGSILRWFGFGHWEWEHEFKTCPAGDRHCNHYLWVRGK